MVLLQSRETQSQEKKTNARIKIVLRPYFLIWLRATHWIPIQRSQSKSRTHRPRIGTFDPPGSCIVHRFNGLAFGVLHAYTRLAGTPWCNLLAIARRMSALLNEE